jgi:hypothetical protein
VAGLNGKITGMNSSKSKSFEGMMKSAVEMRTTRNIQKRICAILYRNIKGGSKKKPVDLSKSVIWNFYAGQ